jgi:RNA recognition motif-containing protein
MSKKLYVGNLPYKADEESLRELFAAIGEVQSVRIITDETGRSKGFGFVEMTSDEEAEKAITSLNGSSLMGRNIIVNEARPQAERGGRAPGKGRPRPYGRER